MSQLGEVQSPPAPPPPIPPKICQTPKLNPKALNTSELVKIDENQINLAVGRLISDSNFSKVFYLSNINLMPQLQDGPKCGLVALSIATSVSGNFVKVDDIFQTAISLGFTKQGEMFSTSSLALLAEKCGFKTRLIKGGLQTHLHCIIKSLLRKHLLLIPYDADFNHSPCCKQGTKAHWCIITGFVILHQNDSDNEVSLENPNSCDCANSSNDADLPLSVSLHPGRISLRKSFPTGTEGEGKLYLIGMQGKSRHVGLWPFEEMSDSNLNLVFFSKSRDSNCFVLPEGGLEEGLKGKAILLDYSSLLP